MVPCSSFDLYLTLTLEVQDHHTIELGTPDILGVGDIFKLLGPLEIVQCQSDLFSGHGDLQGQGQFQGHIIPVRCPLGSSILC